MANVHVTFTEGGKTVVDADTKAAIWQERVHWRFHSLNPRVKKVRIEFDDDDATLFPSPSGSHQNFYEKELADGMIVWGEAPKYAGDQARKKYSIFGLDASGEKITGLDPQLIIDKP